MLIADLVQECEMQTRFLLRADQLVFGDFLLANRIPDELGEDMADKEPHRKDFARISPGCLFVNLRNAQEK